VVTKIFSSFVCGCLRHRLPTEYYWDCEPGTLGQNPHNSTGQGLRTFRIWRTFQPPFYGEFSENSQNSENFPITVLRGKVQELSEFGELSNHHCDHSTGGGMRKPPSSENFSKMQNYYKSWVPCTSGASLRPSTRLPSAGERSPNAKSCFCSEKLGRISTE